MRRLNAGTTGARLSHHAMPPAATSASAASAIRDVRDVDKLGFTLALSGQTSCTRRASEINQGCRSGGSIHTSMKLEVAMSRCVSHTLCASRNRVATVGADLP